jgi:hypothetical protein
MDSPLVSRPPYGEGTARTPRAVAELPSGGSVDKGVPLDPGIPGTSTYAKPVDDVRAPDNKDESIYRVEEPGDLTKDQTTPDNIDHSKAKPSFNGLGKPDPRTLTPYPYRDQTPNAHNAAFLAELWKLEGSRVAVINGSVQIKVASNVEEILTGLDQKFQERANKCSAQVKRADIKNLRWIFSVDCGHGPKAVKVRAIPKGRSKKFSTLDLELSCSCPAWQWLGPEFHAKSEKFMLKPQNGTASTPDIRDPERDNRVCKHVAAALAITKHWEIPKVKMQKAVKKAMRVRRAVRAAMDRRAVQLLWATEALNPDNWQEGLRMDWNTPDGLVTAYIRARGDVSDYAEFQFRREDTSWPKLWNKTRDLVGALGRLGVTQKWAFVPPKVQIWLREKM